jgi:hypothetical protein
MGKYKQKSIMAKALTPNIPGEVPFVHKKGVTAERASSIMPLDTPPREKQGPKMAKALMAKGKENPAIGLDVGKKLNVASIRNNLKKKK